MRGVRLLLVVACAVAMCGCAPQASSPTTTPTSATTAASPSPGGTRLVPPGPSPAASSAAVENYLSVARDAQPRLSDDALVAQAHTICSVIQHGSRHDAVGALAGQLGDQATANRLVTAAVAAYCPELAGNR